MNILEQILTDVNRHIEEKLKRAMPDIATELMLHGFAAIKNPIKIEKVGGELKATVGISVQLCSASELYITSPGEEVGGGTRMDHL